MPFDLGFPELLILLVIVVLLFGVGRISKISGELGKGIRAFREGLQVQEINQENKVEDYEAKAK